MKKIKLIALIGKAGSGKNSLLRLFSQNNFLEYNIAVPFTSRPIRSGEFNGQDYYFLTETQVEDLMRKDDILYHTMFNNWHYGLQKSLLLPDKINIGIFDPATVLLLKDYTDLDMVTIYITTTDKERLLRQLMREKEPDVHEIVRRFSADEKDFDHKKINNLPNLTILDNSKGLTDTMAVFYNILDNLQIFWAK